MGSEVSTVLAGLDGDAPLVTGVKSP